MIKKIFLGLSMLFIIFLFSGCSLPTSVAPAKSSIANATFIRSDDGSISWLPKIKIDDKKNITGIDVLTMAINPLNSNEVYLGTVANGLFSTKDAGETWTQAPYLDKVYGLVFDPKNPEIMYGTGLKDDRAKIFKRIGENQEWKEVYTEPEKGTIISSLAIDNNNSEVLYVGTNVGVIIKTTDGGKTWVNLALKAPVNAPIVSIGFDAANSSHVFFAVFQVGILETKDAGANIEDITAQIDSNDSVSSIYMLVADPYLAGVVYTGTERGIFRRNNNGSWIGMNLIESSKAFPIRTIAINPKNSKELLYSAGRAIYKTIDSGATWSTFQLDTAKEISIFKYNQMDPSKIYAGLRSF